MLNKRAYNYKKLPIYVQVAFDLYFDHMSIEDVAIKYNRSVKQIKWLISKCIKFNLPKLHKQISKFLHNEEIKTIPFYAQVAIYMCRNNADVIKVMNEYNCPRRKVNEALRRTNLQLPIIYNFINNTILNREKQNIKMKGN